MIGKFFSLLLLLSSDPSLGAPMGKSTAATSQAIFAGGCFWCMQPPFDGVTGVVETIVGYTGGHIAHPTYEQVSSGRSGHVEAILVKYDPKVVSYGQLVDIFWTTIDPTDGGGQFADRGSQYRSVIFTATDEQEATAQASKKRLVESGKFKDPIRTTIEKATAFYPAEEYHQKYYQKNSFRYDQYKKGSGRADFLEKTWKGITAAKAQMERPAATPSPEKLKKSLSPDQYHVTQENGTERPFENKYWDNKRAGIYVDVVSGEPLFSSLDKYDSGTGWPSFTKPIDKDNLQLKEDGSLLMSRTEVRSRQGNSHLGHVFPDGPGPTQERYCINSAALRFVPLEDLEREGYGAYKKLFSPGK